ncbi:MAG TPA: NAD(P)H-dependent glycerol-3-phosphate dehydrogenase, partial [Planctomycetia bacterium]|nr:NAD(P)H-dependent glycerol-3-phosphate dehydrogenase [Planctomycetia bacterium]
GRRLGGKEETFFGIAGLGDLITTCISGHGRNLHLGRQLAAGRKLDEILAGTRQVFEGVWTAASVRDLAAREACPMPIAEEVHRILFEGKSPRAAVTDLMNRDLKSEWGERE